MKTKAFVAQDSAVEWFRVDLRAVNQERVRLSLQDDRTVRADECPGDALDLIKGGRRGDVRIEPTARGRDEIHGNGCGVAGIGGAKRIDP